MLEREIEVYYNDNCQHIFRGKFELDFFRKIIDSLKQKSKENNYFEIRRECVNLDVNTNTISTLSEYADTPKCLIEFLKDHQQCGYSLERTQ